MLHVQLRSQTAHAPPAPLLLAPLDDAPLLDDELPDELDPLAPLDDELPLPLAPLDEELDPPASAGVVASFDASATEPPPPASSFDSAGSSKPVCPPGRGVDGSMSSGGAPDELPSLPFVVPAAQAATPSTTTTPASARPLTARPTPRRPSIFPALLDDRDRHAHGARDALLPPLPVFFQDTLARFHRAPGRRGTLAGGTTKMTSP